MRSQAKKISTSLEVGMNRLKVIYDGMNAPIKSLEAKEAANQTAKALVYCAKNYMGARVREEDMPLYAEGAAFICSKFGSLGIAEIKEAFSLAAAKKFEVDLKAYYGSFSLAVIGELLQKYIKYRSRIVIAIQSELEAKERQEREKAEAEMKNQDTKEAVCKEIAQLITARNEGMPFYEDWRDIPSFYTQIALENKIIVIEHERKKEIWKEAKRIAYNELKKEKTTKFVKGELSSDYLKSYIKKLEESTAKGLDEKAKNIYSKLLLWEFIKPLD